MDIYEFTLVRYDNNGHLTDIVVRAKKNEIQHFLDDGWRVVIIKPTNTNSQNPAISKTPYY